MIHKRPLVAVTAVAAAASLLLGGCQSNTGGTTQSGITLVTEGKLSVCTHLPYEPMEFKDESGKVVGFEIDIMDLLAKQMGVTVTVVEVEFAQITSGAVFASKKCDIAAAGMTINDARRKAISFSKPYFDVTQTVAVPINSTITKLEDLKGKKLAIETDSTAAEWANKTASTNGFETVVFDDAATTLNSLLSGRADASILDNVYVYRFVSANATTTKIGFEIETGEVYGFGASLDDNGKAIMAEADKLLDQINSDGTYLSIYKKWVNPTATSAGLPKS